MGMGSVMDLESSMGNRVQHGNGVVRGYGILHGYCTTRLIHAQENKNEPSTGMGSTMGMEPTTSMGSTMGHGGWGVVNDQESRRGKN